MSDFIQSGAAGVSLHITHLKGLLTVAIIMVLWWSVSLVGP